MTWMDRQNEQVSAPLAPEVVAALRDLARMAEHAGSAVSDAPGSVARILLERLLVLCAAQRGALLLIEYPSRESADDFRSTASSSRILHTFALHAVSEEEAHALLQLFPSGGASIKTASGEHFWVVYHLPLTAPFVQQQGHEEPGRATIEQETGQTAQPVQAVLLLGWTGQEDAERTSSAAEKGRTILPFVAEAVGAVLVNILLAGRVHELETALENRSRQEMELLKAELLATVSHELRSPLASIKGYAATLLRHERRISREERHEFLLAITQASDRLAGVIDRLFEMSQLETGDIHIELTVVNLAYLVREAITAIEQRFVEPDHLDRRSPLTLQLEDERRVPTNEEPVIWADRHHLREVLDNLLDNAIHYSPEGGAIEVIIRPVFTRGQTSRPRTAASRDGRDDRQAMTPLAKQEAQRMVEICVRDHGIGIPPAHLERVFDRFHRVDTRLTREVNGMGLGLAICKRMVELHGGTIWAESDIGQGSTFHVWLPMDARLSR